MGIEKKTYTFHLNEEVAEKIRSLVNMVETILINYITEREKES